MAAEKSPWRKPEMTILVRSRPEEAVLMGCKLPVLTAGPGSTHNRCKRGPGKSCNTNCSMPLSS